MSRYRSGPPRPPRASRARGSDRTAETADAVEPDVLSRGFCQRVDLLRLRARAEREGDGNLLLLLGRLTGSASGSPTFLQAQRDLLQVADAVRPVLLAWIASDSCVSAHRLGRWMDAVGSGGAS